MRMGVRGIHRPVEPDKRVYQYRSVCRPIVSYIIADLFIEIFEEYVDKFLVVENVAAPERMCVQLARVLLDSLAVLAKARK